MSGEEWLGGSNKAPKVMSQDPASFGKVVDGAAVTAAKPTEAITRTVRTPSHRKVSALITAGGAFRARERERVCVCVCVSVPLCLFVFVSMSVCLCLCVCVYV